MDITSFDLESNEPFVASLPEGEAASGWEMVDVGRYRPRRTRGSCVGRELG